MKPSRSFILGVVTSIIVFAIIGCIIFVKTMSSIDVFGGYPNGSGKHEASPDKKWEAHASNMSDKTFNGTIIHYFNFSVEDKNTGEPIIVHRFPQPDFKVMFRQGNGIITWSKDSTEVTFGTVDEVVWSYKIPESELQTSN